MKVKLNILRFNRQKIPSINENLAGLYPPSFAIPRKTHISGNFHLNTSTINIKINNFVCNNTLIFS